MAITITPKLTLISNCDATTGWDNGATNSDVPIEGVNCLGVKASNTTSVVCKFDEGAGGVDRSGEHFYIWALVLGTVDTIALGGLRCYFEDTGGNYKTCYVVGSETYTGGWIRLVCSYDATNDGPSSGTYSSAVHRYVGIQFKTTSKSAQANCFWDFCHYGSGLKVTSGATDDIDWDDIAGADYLNGPYGVVIRAGGIIGLNGEVELGDTSTLSIDMLSKNEVVVAQDLVKAETDLIGITVSGNSGGTTNVTFGESSGGRGISGDTVRSAGNCKLWFDAYTSNANIDIFQLYGSNFYDCGIIDFPPNATNREILSCNFEACGLVDPDTCIVKYSNFIASDAVALYIDTVSHNIETCNFISNPHGIDFALSTTISLDGCVFIGSNGASLYDAKHSVSGALIINAGTADNIKTNINGSYIEETGGGSTTVNNTVYLRIYCEDVDGAIVSNAQCAIYKASDDTQLMNEDSVVVTGLAEEAYNYPGSAVDIYYRVRKSSPGVTRYVPVNGTGQVTADGFTLYVVLRVDTVATP